MQVTIISTRIPADATQSGELQKLFSSSGFSLLKEMVAARAIECQVNGVNAKLYPNSERARETADVSFKRAAELQQMLDLLDEFQGTPEKCYTIKIENRR